MPAQTPQALRAARWLERSCLQHLNHGLQEPTVDVYSRSIPLRHLSAHVCAHIYVTSYMTSSPSKQTFWTAKTSYFSVSKLCRTEIKNTILESGVQAPISVHLRKSLRKGSRTSHPLGYSRISLVTRCIIRILQ